METQADADARNHSNAQPTNKNWEIAITTHVVIVSLPDPDLQFVSLAAFDRVTGRELWRKIRTADAGANDSKSNLPSLNGGRQDRTELFPGDIPDTPHVAQPKQRTVHLYVSGTTTGQDGRSVVILLFALAGERTTLEYDLHGIDVESGRELWRFSLAQSRPGDWLQLNGIYGNVISFLNGDHAAFLDAFTGQALFPSTPEGSAALKRAREQYGASCALSFANPDRTRMLHLDTGTVQNLETPRGYASLVGMTASRGVIFVNMDDDYAGHSVWPHYVYSVDGTGKTMWRFPARSLLPGADFDMATGRGFGSDTRPLGHDFEDVVQAQVITASNTALVFSETRYQTQGRKITGLRATDGRVLWRKSEDNIRFLRTYERGCFALMESGQLMYIDAQTGQRQQCGKLLACESLLVADKCLFAVNSNGTITAYDVPRLTLPVPAPRSHSVLPSAPAAPKPAALKPKPISRNILWNFYQAIEKDDVAGVRTGLQQDIPLNKLLPDYDRTPLMLAASSHASKAFHFLLDHRANIHTRALDGTTALHYAAIGGSYSIMRTLLAGGLNMNVRNRVGDTPLMLLTRYNITAPDRVRFLVRHGADINTLNSQNQSALHIAVDQDLVNMARLLLANGADPDVRNKWGGTPLMLAANVTNPDYALLQLLLEKGAAINARDEGGRTPLIHLLWDASVHYISSYRDNEGEQKGPFFTPPHDDCLRLLLRKGADINAQDKQGNTALAWAKFILAKCETDEHRIQAQHVIDILLAAGATR